MIREVFNYSEPRIEGNTGFYFIRASLASIKVWEKSIGVLDRLVGKAPYEISHHYYLAYKICIMDEFRKDLWEG